MDRAQETDRSLEEHAEAALRLWASGDEAEAFSEYLVPKPYWSDEDRQRVRELSDQLVQVIVSALRKQWAWRHHAGAQG